MEIVKYIAFFEDVEVIEKRKRSFPALRAPFRKISKENINSFCILVAIEEIDPSVKSLLEVKIYDPIDEMIYYFGFNGYSNKQDYQFLICEVNNLDLELTGEYKVRVFVNSVEIGDSYFIVEDKENDKNV